MATFTFNQKTLKIYRAALEVAPKGTKVCFIPTLHGGCLQLIYPDEKHNEFFCTQRTGYQALCNDASLIQDALKLDKAWLDALERAKTAKFQVTISKATEEIAHNLTTKKRKG